MRQEHAGEQGWAWWGMCLLLRARTAHNCPSKLQRCNPTATVLLQQEVWRDLIAPVLELGNYSWSKHFGTEVIINHVVRWFSWQTYSGSLQSWFLPSLLINICNKINATDLLSEWPFGHRKRCKSEPQSLNAFNCTAKKTTTNNNKTNQKNQKTKPTFGLETNFSSFWKRKIFIKWDDFWTPR